MTVWLPITVRDDASPAFAVSGGNGGPAAFTGTGILTMISNPNLSNSLQATITASTSSSAPDRGAGGTATPGYASFTPVNGTVTAYYEVTTQSPSVSESTPFPFPFRTLPTRFRPLLLQPPLWSLSPRPVRQTSRISAQPLTPLQTPASSRVAPRPCYFPTS